MYLYCINLRINGIFVKAFYTAASLKNKFQDNNCKRNTGIHFICINISNLFNHKKIKISQIIIFRLKSVVGNTIA